MSAAARLGVWDCVAKLRPKRPVPRVVRLKTAPGVQAQVDFATMNFSDFSLKLFVALLDYLIWLFALFVLHSSSNSDRLKNSSNSSLLQ